MNEYRLFYWPKLNCRSNYFERILSTVALHVNLHPSQQKFPIYFLNHARSFSPKNCFTRLSFVFDTTLAITKAPILQSPKKKQPTWKTEDNTSVKNVKHNLNLLFRICISPCFFFVHIDQDRPPRMDYVGDGLCQDGYNIF